MQRWSDSKAKHVNEEVDPLEVLLAFGTAESKALRVVSHEHLTMSRIDICTAKVA